MHIYIILYTRYTTYICLSPRPKILQSLWYLQHLLSSSKVSPRTQSVMPVKIRMVPRETARHACHRQAFVTFPNPGRQEMIYEMLPLSPPERKLCILLGQTTFLVQSVIKFGRIYQRVEIRQLSLKSFFALLSNYRIYDCHTVIVNH